MKHAFLVLGGEAPNHAQKEAEWLAVKIVVCGNGSDWQYAIDFVFVELGYDEKCINKRDVV